MSTRAVKKAMVKSGIAEINLLKKGSIDLANDILKTRITCMDKLWVVTTYGNDPAYKEMVDYLWEQVKDLTLLLSHPSDKEEILCLGSPPVIDDDSEPYCPGTIPIPKYDLTLDVDYVGNDGEADGLSGSFKLDGTTINFLDYTKYYYNVIPLESGSYELDFTNTIYKDNGANAETDMYYKFNIGDAWISSPTKKVPIDIVSSAVNVYVKFEIVPPVTAYDVTVSLQYVGGADANDGLNGDLVLDIITESLPPYAKNALYTYTLDIDSYILDLTGIGYYADGLLTDFELQYRFSLGDAWATSPTKQIPIDVVDQPITIYLQWLFVAPSSYPLNFFLEFNGPAGATDGFDGLITVAGANFNVTKYDKTYNNSYVVAVGVHDIDLTALETLLSDISQPFTVDYRYDVGDAWLPLGSKLISVNVSGVTNVYFRCNPQALPTAYNLNLSMQYIGGSDPTDGISGSYDVDVLTENIGGIVKTVNEVYLLDIGSHDVDITNIVYNVLGVSKSWDAQYSLNGGSTWNPVVANSIPISIVSADVNLLIQFTQAAVQQNGIDFEVSYVGVSGPTSGLTGSFKINNEEVINITPAYTELFQITSIPRDPGTYSVYVGTIGYNVDGILYANDVEYQIDGGGWIPLALNSFDVILDGSHAPFVEIRLTQQEVLFDAIVDITYIGGSDANDGLGGTFELLPSVIPYDALYTKYQQHVEPDLAVSSYLLDFSPTDVYVDGGLVPFTVEYKFLPDDPWSPATLKEITFDIVNRDVEIYVRITPI